jgi:hypothetical protein
VCAGKNAYVNRTVRRPQLVAKRYGSTKVALRTDATGISSATVSAHTLSPKSVRSATAGIPTHVEREVVEKVALQADAAEWWSKRRGGLWKGFTEPPR